MKFTITKAVLVALTLGESSLAEKIIGDSNDSEDDPFWRSFIGQGVDSMAVPTTKPSVKPIEITSEPTNLPIDPSTATPTQLDTFNSTSAPSLTAGTSSPSSNSSSSCESIETLICSVPEFGTLCELVDLADLGDSFNEDIFTIFAPTNDAFDSLPEIPALTDFEVLRDVLLYHTVPEVTLLSGNLVCDGDIMMGSKDFNETTTTTTCVGEDIFQVGTGNSPDGLPLIIGFDAEACNGIIHAINQVILPTLTTLPPVAPTPVPVDQIPAPTDSTTAPVDPPTPVPSDPTNTTIVPTTTPVDPVPPTFTPIESTATPTDVVSCQSIAELVCSLPQFELLCALVGDAGLASVLDGEEKFTVFAPINDAFTGLSEELASAIISDAELLTSVLLSHVVDDEVFSTDLECSGEVEMVSGEATTTICVSDRVFQSGDGNSADSLPEIIAADKIACNGVIHEIDRVILPRGEEAPVEQTPATTPGPSQVPVESTTSPTLVPTQAPSQIPIEATSAPVDIASLAPTEAPSIVGVPQTSAPTTTSDSCQTIAEVVCSLPEFELLCSLIGLIDLPEAVDGEETFTLFAPINDAFTGLPADLSDEIISDTDLLASVLLSHAVAGKVFSTDLSCSGQVTMISGEETTTECVDDLIFQSGAGNTPGSFPEIVAPDGVACNGVIHGIDRVILPAAVGVDPVDLDPDSPDALSFVRDVLSKYLLNGGAELDDPDSYQSRALEQTASITGAESLSEEELVQYYVLYSILFATNGVPNAVTEAIPNFEIPTWINDEGWFGGDIPPCDGWFGISCDEEGKIKTIDLFDNGLTGVFPPEVLLLTSDSQYAMGAGTLERLDLTGNRFLSNNNDSSWMTDLGTSMQTISVENTSFGGSLPRLPDGLVNLDISGAFYTDGLDDATFEGLELMNFIDLDNNLFEGSVPAVFNRLPTLEFLYLSGNSFTGDLSFMEGMPAMRELWIDNNPELTGQLYDFIGDISTLESFSVSYSMLTGPIPESFGELEQMKQMWLTSNNLTGAVPASLGNLNFMETLQLEGNDLTGSMPDEICAQKFDDFLTVLGGDCTDEQFECSCCTCCGVEDCNDTVESRFQKRRL
ncbi:unnamed protein product [Pseudo-nitzschia multistriata]|uniref:FAS1 domain-containing protein n=1 Tax=Pseudo-nitzschia multistriata TaxID=183589 RepID=A0A448Z504_9STRA|nr:unnamed protein product [Pseudo-nitzschia multistriata]